jgi:drug/metabolite transporter (DMT)-like permease
MTAVAASPLAVDRAGAALVAASALVWSFGGAIDRFIDVADPWTKVFWRSLWGAAFLIGFLALRDGPRGAARLFAAMGAPGLTVAVCFAVASTSFVVALGLTSVANIVLIQAIVPLIAAALGWAAFGERVAPATWVAIAAVIAGVGVMVSGSLAGETSLAGDALALLIACAFAVATVVTRRHAGVRMTPACALGCLIACVVAATLAGGFRVAPADAGLLFAFGALNLGLGMALFATGARRVPAALAALLGTLEPVASPFWVWLVHGETPSVRTAIGGGVVLATLAVHLGMQAAGARRRGA